ncbi:MAG: GNAT family N-acetyltransferase [Nitrososphaerota archaeon]
MKIFSATTKNIDSYPTAIVRKFLLTTSNYNLYVAKIDNKIIGISLFYIFKKLKIGFLDFMAVSPTEQNEGIGTKMFQLTVNVISKEIINPIGVVFLVIKESNSNSRETKIRKKRIQFYMRLGALVFENVTFYLVPIKPSDKPNEAYVMVFPLTKVDYFERKVARKFIDAIYKKVYLYGKRDLVSLTVKGMPAKIRLSNRLAAKLKHITK